MGMGFAPTPTCRLRQVSPPPLHKTTLTTGMSLSNSINTDSTLLFVCLNISRRASHSDLSFFKTMSVVKMFGLLSRDIFLSIPSVRPSV